MISTRGLVSCAQCHLAASGRTLHADYAYYVCRGRSDPLRGPKTSVVRLAMHRLTNDQLVWQDLCRLLTDPTLITHELVRAQAGEWLPQALQDRQRTLRTAVAQLERQQIRLSKSTWPR